jgi:phosphoglycerol transferase MdoB-like AlkP superfamily enzyme
MTGKIFLLALVLLGFYGILFLLLRVGYKWIRPKEGGAATLMEAFRRSWMKILFDAVRLNLAFTAILLLLRMMEYFSLGSAHALPQYAILLEMQGFLNDFIAWQFISWALLFPFFILSLFRRWAGIFFFGLVFFIFSSAEWALFQYFRYTLTPLDELIFSYTAREIIVITGSSVSISLLTFLPFLILLITTAAMILLFLRLHVTKILAGFFIICSAGILILRHSFIPDEGRSKNLFEHYMVINKSMYFSKKCALYISERSHPATDAMAEAAAIRYQSAHPEFSFIGTQYPFLHYDNTPDVLGSFFDLKSEKPNIVIVICESLSSCFSGTNNIFGSFTPFLDSLSNHSLYWPNFLSTADRTFNVLQAVTGSLPPGDPTYVDANFNERYPYHMSLIRYLGQNGYHSSFFYGGAVSFNNMEDYLVRQKTDYILKTFGPGYQKQSFNQEYGWGYSDLDMFRRSFEVMDSLKGSPRLDLYLTLSTHAPFIVPDQNTFLSKVDERINRESNKDRADDLKRYREIFASILYLDQSLKEFMNSYRKKPGYENTIFLITGDHAMAELNLYRFSLIEQFHVPVIIYSPMLKKSATFQSISSHLDITPTLLAMLKRKYGIEIHSVASWLGNGIDTARKLRNIHSLPFILNSKEIPYYVSHMDYLSPGKISRIGPGMTLKKIHDPRRFESLSAELKDFKLLNIYTERQNRLIPKEIYFEKFLHNDTLSFRVSEMTSVDSLWEFKNLLKLIPVDPKYKLLGVEVSVDFMTSKTPSGKPPIIVFDLYSSGKKRLLWQSFDIFGDSLKKAQPGKWANTFLKEYIDLNYLKRSDHDTLLVYLWNKEHCSFRVAKPGVSLVGYY